MLGILDSVIIVISLTLVIGAVLRAAGKKQTDAEHFLAGRDLPWPFIGMSLLASNISAEHVVGLAGDGYPVGLPAGAKWMAVWAVLGVLAAPLVGLSVTIRNYLEMISAYLGVPLCAVIFAGLLWKRGNIAGAVAGFALSIPSSSDAQDAILDPLRRRNCKATTRQSHPYYRHSHRHAPSFHLRSD